MSNKFTVHPQLVVRSYSIHAYRIGNIITMYATFDADVNTNTSVFILADEYRVKNHTFFTAENIGRSYTITPAHGIVNKDNNHIVMYPENGDHIIAMQFSAIIPIEQIVNAMLAELE